MVSRSFIPSSMRAFGLDLIEPKRWPNDGGRRREPVVDPNFEPARIVCHVGWRPCMRCGRHFFSEDVGRVRLDDQCRNILNRPTSD